MFDERWEEMCSWGFDSVQNKAELEWLYMRMQGKSSYLEIGTSFGGSLWVIADALAPGSKIVSVDLPKVWKNPNKWHRDRKNFENVDSIADSLRAGGHEVHIIRADSHDKDIVNLVEKLGPYDACFIDGDHSAIGVQQDHENYSPMCKESYFHDIVTPGVRSWWNTVDRVKVEHVSEYGMGGLL